MTPQDIAKVKGMGFLINRGTEKFSGRIVPAGAIFTAEDLAVIADIAKKYGNGKIAFTSRLTAEIVGIPLDKVDEVVEYAAKFGLKFGGTGAKIRPVTACKGTTCIYGNYDTQALAEKIHNDYYIGWSDVKLPHKFKIGIGGCPNSCMKPSLNDFGIEGHRNLQIDLDKCRGCKVCQVEKFCPSKVAKCVDGKVKIDAKTCRTCGVCTNKCPFGAVAKESPVVYQIYVGGTWGKKTRMGTPLSHMIDEDEIFPMLEKTMLWFKENAFEKERLGMAIDRLGVEKFEKDTAGDDLLCRKDEIIAREINKR